MRGALVQQPATLSSMAMLALGDWIASQDEKLVSPIQRNQRRDVPRESPSLYRIIIETIRKYLLRTMPKVLLPIFRLQLAEPATAKLFSPQIEVIRNYLVKLPKMFHDQLFETVVSCLHCLYYESGRANVGQVLEALFTQHLTYLSEERLIFYELCSESIYSKSHALTGLRKLKLKCNVSEEITINLLKQLHGLEHLTIYSCTDNILKCVVENCGLIEELCLHDSAISETCIDLLIDLSKLKQLTLYTETRNISKHKLATLLMSCPNLERFWTSWKITEILEHIVSLEYADKRFKFHFYSNYFETAPEQLQLVVTMCPLIHTLKLKKYTTSPNYLMALTALQNLRELRLLSFDFYADRVNDVLQSIGCSLVHLELASVKQVDLMYICQMCPNLETLTILSGTLVKATLENEMLSREIKMVPLRFLQNLSLGYFRPKLTDEQIICLLSNCPKIEHVGIETLTDAVVLQVLDNNPKSLMYLEALSSCSELSMLAIDRIIANCINAPTITKLLSAGE